MNKRSKLLCLFFFILSTTSGYSQNNLDDGDAKFIGLFVNNFDSTFIWYERILNAKVLRKSEVTQANLKFAMLDVNGFLIEMIQNPKVVKKSEINQKYEGNIGVEGFFKLGFKVKDIESTYKLMKVLGVKFRYELMNNDNFKWRLFIVEDPEGNLIQFYSEYNK